MPSIPAPSLSLTIFFPQRAAQAFASYNMSSSILRSPVQHRHSAEVKMELRIDGQKLPLRQIGPDFLTLEAPVDAPPCLGTIWFSIDGREHEKKVRLPNGMTAKSNEVEIALP